MHCSACGVTALLTAVLICSCATARQSAGVIEGRGDELLADSISMTGNVEVWGGGMQVAGFTAGVLHEGVRCVAAAIPFGETAVAWNFSGLAPGAALEVVFGVNVDFFGKETYLHVACMPGRRDARRMREPRDEFRAFLSQGWADGSAEWPDSTEGWRAIRSRGVRADGNGEITVVMIFGHPKEDPPLAAGYFTNPIVRAIGRE